MSMARSPTGGRNTRSTRCSPGRTRRVLKPSRLRPSGTGALSTVGLPGGSPGVAVGQCAAGRGGHGDGRVIGGKSFMRA
jgi:hypothetical protein